eukprot:jgi/Botrbrau1/5467/Bobra.27_1s0018.1
MHPGTLGGPVQEQVTQEPQAQGEEEILDEDQDSTPSSKPTGPSRLEELLKDNPEQLGGLLRAFSDLFPKGLPWLPPHRHVYHTVWIQPRSVPPRAEQICFSFVFVRIKREK